MRRVRLARSSSACSPSSRSSPPVAAATTTRTAAAAATTRAAPSARASRAATSPSSPPATSTTSTRARRTTRSATWSCTPTNRTLYSFEPGRRPEPLPDLADGEPEISEDSKTITVKIKTGVKFAPPVNREVTAEDVKYAIERAFTRERAVGYATSYFADIEGAPAGADATSSSRSPASRRRTTRRSSSSSPSRRRRARRRALVHADHDAGPEEYAEKFDAKNPSTYDQYVAFTGPYMVKNDPSGQGRPAASPGKRIEIVRNPNWDKDDRLPARLPGLDHDRGGQRRPDRRLAPHARAARASCAATPASRRSRSSSARLTQQQGPARPRRRRCTRWIALNTTIKPFDNVNVRKAIIAGFDRDALRLTRGGEEVGADRPALPPARHPRLRGVRRRGGLRGSTTCRTRGRPRARRRSTSRRRPAYGVDGKYDGDEKLLTIATNADPGKQTAQVAQAQFEKLGFKLNFRKVPQDTLYTKFCGVPEGEVAICPNVGWFKDFNDPQSLLEPDVRRRGDQARRQHQLAADRRHEDQRGDDEGRAAPDRRRAQPGLGRRSTR